MSSSTVRRAATRSWRCAGGRGCRGPATTSGGAGGGRGPRNREECWRKRSGRGSRTRSRPRGFVGGGATVTIAPDAIFHSDKGCQYTSAEFRKVLQDNRMRPSVGRTGVCWDNAMAESFNAALKNERVYRTVYPTRRHAVTDVTRYIEHR